MSVQSIKLSLDGGSSYGPSWSASRAPPSPLNKAIDTLTDTQIPIAMRGAGKSGLLGMVVKVQDNATPAPYVNTWFVTLNLDNAYPTTNTYTGTIGNGHDPLDLHGDVGGEHLAADGHRRRSRHRGRHRRWSRCISSRERTS